MAGNKAKRLSSVNHTTKAMQFNSYLIERCKPATFAKLDRICQTCFFLLVNEIRKISVPVVFDYI